MDANIKTRVGFKLLYGIKKPGTGHNQIGRAHNPLLVGKNCSFANGMCRANIITDNDELNFRRGGHEWQSSGT